MRISELIVKLATIAEAEGDLDVIHQTGEPVTRKARS